MLTRSSPGGRFRNKTWWDLRCERCLTALTKGQRGITFFHPLFSSSCRVFLLFLHTLIFCVASTLPHCEALFSFTNWHGHTHDRPEGFLLAFSRTITPLNFSFQMTVILSFSVLSCSPPSASPSPPSPSRRFTWEFSINHLLAFHHHQWLNSEGILYYLTSSQAFA